MACRHTFLRKLAPCTLPHPLASPNGASPDIGCGPWRSASSVKCAGKAGFGGGYVSGPNCATIVGSSPPSKIGPHPGAAFWEKARCGPRPLELLVLVRRTVCQEGYGRQLQTIVVTTLLFYFSFPKQTKGRTGRMPCPDATRSHSATGEQSGRR